MAAVVAAALELLVGLWLLSNAWHGSPVAAPFTRVGGPTRLETAVEASRFWLEPPRRIVEVPPGASETLMMQAAQCAMVKDAPLLFTSLDPKRNRPVTAMINGWHAISAGSAQPQPIPGCLPPQQADVSGLSTLAVPQPRPQLQRIAVSHTLAPVVVFAAVWSPQDPADVAVGMALAAHLTRADRGKVSLVVVPRYLEADRGLENQLRSQHELVEDGVVLGSSAVIPDQTRTLLRQLLVSVDQQGVLAQLENTLGTAGILATALITLITFGVAAATAPALIREVTGTQPTQDAGELGGYQPGGGDRPDGRWRRFLVRLGFKPRRRPLRPQRGRSSPRVLIVRVQPSNATRPKWARRGTKVPAVGREGRRLRRPGSP